MFKDAEILNEKFHSRDLRRSDFSYSEFTNSDFHDCKLERAEFLGAEFQGCDFVRCDFTKAFLTGAIFEKCIFMDCKFDEAYIFRSQFKDCIFEAGSMTNALMSTIDFSGSKLNHVKWRDTFINSPPLIIDGIEYPIVALDNGYMHVGCELNTYDWFWNTDEKYSAAMEGLKARRFWKKNKQWIFDMLKVRGLYDYTRR